MPVLKMNKLMVLFSVLTVLAVDFANCENALTVAVGGIFHEYDYETEDFFRHGIIQANQELQFELYHRPDTYFGKPRTYRQAENNGDEYAEETETSQSMEEQDEVKENGETDNYYDQLPENIRFLPNVQYVGKHDSFKTGKLACEMTESGIAAIFGPKSQRSSRTVESICSAMAIPHIQTTPMGADDPHTTESIINLYPDPRVLSQAFADLVKAAQWKSYVIIYQHQEALVRLQGVLKLLTKGDDTLIIRQLQDEVDHRPLLKEIESKKIVNIILDCDTDMIVEVLTQAKEVRLLEDYHNYIITSLDAHTLDYGSLLDNLPNITVVTMVDPYSTYVENVIRDVSSHSPRKRYQMSPRSLPLQAALTYDAMKLFTSTVRSIYKTQRFRLESCSCDDEPLRKWNIGLLIVETMKERTIENGLSGVIQFDKLGRRTNFTLHVLQLSVKELLTGNITRDGYHSYRSDADRQSEIIENIHKKKFIVSSRLGRPYLMERMPKEGLTGNDRYEGYSMDLIANIARVLNFTFEFRLAPDGKYGSYDPVTKKWNGLIEQLLLRNADLAICDLTITYDRRSAVDFTMPFMTLGISILYSKQAKEPPDLFSFTSPLSVDVWLYMATAFIGIAFLVFFVARMSPDDWENPHPCNQDPEEYENCWDLKNSLWLTLGSIMAQGCDILPKGSSTRIVTGMWWFFSLILLSSYTANLAAFLTMERMGPTIESAEDLAKQTKIKYGAVSGGSTLAFFKNSNFSTYQRMWAAMESARPSVFTSGNPEGVDRVLKSKNGFAFLMESTSIEYEVERNCDLTQVGGLLDSKGYGIAMPVNSPYRTLISGAVLKLQEDGVLRRLKQIWWQEKYGGGSCSQSVKAAEGSAELDIANVGGVFLVLIIGMFLALVVAILEFLWNVHQIAVDEQLSFSEALLLELKFAINIFVTIKAAKSKASESDNASESRSIARSIVRSAGSFLNVNLFNNGSAGSKR